MYTHISKKRAEKLFYAIKSGKISPYFTDVVIVPVGTDIHKDCTDLGYITSYQANELNTAVNCYINNQNHNGNKCTKVSYYLWEENTNDLKELTVGIHTHFSSHDIQRVRVEDFDSVNFMCGTDRTLGFAEDLNYITKALVAKKNKREYTSVYICDYYGKETKYKVKTDSVIHPDRVRPLYTVFKELQGDETINTYSLIGEYLKYLFE